MVDYQWTQKIPMDGNVPCMAENPSFQRGGAPFVKNQCSEFKCEWIMNVITSFGEWTDSFARAKGVDVSMIFFGQFEIENINIFVDAIFGDGFW